MPTCWVCREKYYSQTEVDPEEPCWCGAKLDRLDDLFSVRLRNRARVARCAVWLIGILAKIENWLYEFVKAADL